MNTSFILNFRENFFHCRKISGGNVVTRRRMTLAVDNIEKLFLSQKILTSSKLISIVFCVYQIFIVLELKNNFSRIFFDRISKKNLNRTEDY